MEGLCDWGRDPASALLALPLASLLVLAVGYVSLLGQGEAWVTAFSYTDRMKGDRLCHAVPVASQGQLRVGQGGGVARRLGATGYCTWV